MQIKRRREGLAFAPAKRPEMRWEARSGQKLRDDGRCDLEERRGGDGDDRQGGQNERGGQQDRGAGRGHWSVSRGSGFGGLYVPPPLGVINE